MAPYQLPPVADPQTAASALENLRSEVDRMNIQPALDAELHDSQQLRREGDQAILEAPTHADLDLPISDPIHPVEGVRGKEVKLEAATNNTLLAAEGDATDSGYASAPTFHFATSRLDKEALLSCAEGPDDTKTIYSAATTVLDDSAQQCIIDVCKDIYANIGGCIDDMTWESISQGLPFRIKSFASQLGYGADDETSRRTMYFVHKHHQ